jgi:hypothetical protein
MNKPCPDDCNDGLIAPPGVEEPIDCSTCDGEGFISVEEDEEE